MVKRGPTRRASREPPDHRERNPCPGRGTRTVAIPFPRPCRGVIVWARRSGGFVPSSLHHRLISGLPSGTHWTAGTASRKISLIRSLSPLDIFPARDRKRTSTNTMHIRMTTPVATRTLAYFHQRRFRFVSWQQAPAVHRSAFRLCRAACPSGVRPLCAGRLAGVPSRENLPGGESLDGVCCSGVGRIRKALGHRRIDLGLIQKDVGLFQLDRRLSELYAGLF